MSPISTAPASSSTMMIGKRPFRQQQALQRVSVDAFLAKSPRDLTAIGLRLFHFTIKKSISRVFTFTLMIGIVFGQLLESRAQEGGEAHLVGKRLKPFGFEGLADGQMPFKELLVRVNRITFREFTRNPDLPEPEFKRILGAEILSSRSNPQAVDDLLFVQESVFLDRSWWSASLLLTPNFLKERATREKWSSERLAGYRKWLERLRQIEKRYRDAADEAERELHRVAQNIVTKWDSAKPSILDANPKQ